MDGLIAENNLFQTTLGRPGVDKSDKRLYATYNG